MKLPDTWLPRQIGELVRRARNRKALNALAQRLHGIAVKAARNPGLTTEESEVLGWLVTALRVRAAADSLLGKERKTK